MASHNSGVAKKIYFSDLKSRMTDMESESENLPLKLRSPDKAKTEIKNIIQLNSNTDILSYYFLVIIKDKAKTEIKNIIQLNSNTKIMKEI